MRKNHKKILIIFILLILILLALLGHTYSRYITTINGKGIIEVAKWAFIVNGENSSTTNIKLAQTYNPNTLVENRIAPGTKGSFDIVIDTTGSEVGIDYCVKFENENNKPKNMEFSYGDLTVKSIKELEDVLKGNISADTQDKVKTLTINWQWKYETGSTKEEIETNDAKDTQDAKLLSQFQFDIIVVGTQVEPTI